MPFDWWFRLWEHKGSRLVVSIDLPVGFLSPLRGPHPSLKLFHMSPQAPFTVWLWVSASLWVSYWVEHLRGQPCYTPVCMHNSVSLMLSGMPLADLLSSRWEILNMSPITNACSIRSGDTAAQVTGLRRSCYRRGWGTQKAHSFWERHPMLWVTICMAPFSLTWALILRAWLRHKRGCAAAHSSDMTLFFFWMQKPICFYSTFSVYSCICSFSFGTLKSDSKLYMYIYMCVCVCTLHVYKYMYIYVCILPACRPCSMYVLCPQGPDEGIISPWGWSYRWLRTVSLHHMRCSHRSEKILEPLTL
jgi:hypothetical protein